MANLKEIRSSVIAHINSYRPAADLNMPISLLDYTIFGHAGMLLEEYRNAKRVPLTQIEPWMVTELSCKVPVLDEELCTGIDQRCPIRYYIDLPFTLAEIPDRRSIQSVTTEKKGLVFRFLEKSRWPYIGLGPAVSLASMKYSIDGNRVYLLAGTRDLSKTKINIRAIAGGPRKEIISTDSWTASPEEDLSKYGYEYSDEVNVPFPPNSRQTLIELVSTSMLRYLGVTLDVVEDGNQNQRVIGQQ